MSDICLNCKKLILEPNVCYGYAGPVCNCPINPQSLFQRPARKEKNIYGINKKEQSYIQPKRHTVYINSSCKSCGEKWQDTIALQIAEPRNKPTEMEWDYCSECYKEENE